MDIQKDAIRFRERKRKRGIFKSDEPYGPRINKVDSYKGIKVDDQIECMDPIDNHQIRKFDKAKLNMIEVEDHKTYFYFMLMGEPYRMLASRFRKVIEDE